MAPSIWSACSRAAATSSSRCLATRPVGSLTSSSGSAAFSGATRRSWRRRPSAALDATLRSAMGQAAVRAAEAVGYVGAGTVEFLVDTDRRFYFLEMNTRLQVEHAVTEETLGCDLVRARLEIAEGRPLPAGWSDGTLSPRGHAIEMRLYAEDPYDFLPRSGRLLGYREPQGPGFGSTPGSSGGVNGLDYDPLLAKLIVWGPDRDAAIGRARRALRRVDRPRRRDEPSAARRRARLRGLRVGPLHDRSRRVAGASPRAAAPDAAWIAAALTTSAAHRATRGGSSPAGSDPWSEGSGWRVGA